MLLFRRSYLVLLRADLYPPARVAVRIEAKPGRWPEYEEGDRLTVAVGFAALAADKAAASRLEPLKSGLRSAATAISNTPTGPLPADVAPLEGFGTPGFLHVVQWQGPGQIEIEADVIKSAGGRIPRMRKEPKTSGPTREFTALATVLAIAADASAYERLTLALGIEGLLAWYRQSSGSSSAKDVLAFAMAHTEDRLREIGRPMPKGV